jgi:hypothetical protein
MELKLFINKGYHQFKEDDPVNSSRAITSFAASNSLRDCLVRAQGGWYKIELNGIMTFQTRALYLISFKDLYYILKD